MPKRPNVLFVLSDDQGPWAMGRSNPEIQTPHLDRLACEGLALDNFFVATPVCSPSRATFLTGRIPSQHGVYDYLEGRQVGPDAHAYLQDETCYTELLARNGWTCGLSGKWHLGACQLPQHGFRDWYCHQGGGSPYQNAPMVRNGQLIKEPGYITERITDEALAMLERYAEAQNPFYLSVHYTAPHSPWIGQHPQAYVDRYTDCPFQSCPQEPKHPWAGRLTDGNLGNREALKGYFAAVTAMDDQIGRLLAFLDARGLRENTLVCFFSDNGFSCGHHGFWGKGNGTMPRNMYENSIRVPALLSLPGRIPQGVSHEELLSAYDFCPTLLDYLELPAIADRNLPGRSFAPLLRGEALDARDEVVIFDEYGPVRMIRTREWKFVYRHAHGEHELFDLMHDPSERTNLARESGQQERIRELKSRMDGWFARYAVPQRDGLKTDGSVYGQKNPL
ncbi:MAG: arylsulfatase A family protein [Planctomycetota bacterium]